MVVACSLLFAVCCFSFVVCCLLFVVCCCLLFVAVAVAVAVVVGCSLFIVVVCCRCCSSMRPQSDLHLFTRLFWSTEVLGCAATHRRKGVEERARTSIAAAPTS